MSRIKRSRKRASKSTEPTAEHAVDERLRAEARPTPPAATNSLPDPKQALSIENTRKVRIKVPAVAKPKEPNMSVKPLGNKVVVVVDKKQSKRVEEAARSLESAKVLAVAPSVKGVSEGDQVLYSAAAGLQLSLDGKPVKVLDESALVLDLGADEENDEE